jgi:hypothetical protein
MIAQPFPYTSLSLARYAKILGINPVHFAGAVGQAVWPLIDNRCADIWIRQSWQYSDHVSLYDVAQAISDAEQDIADVLGYYVAPRWIENETHRYTQHYRDGGNSRGDWRRYAGTKVRWGKIVETGRRATTLVGTASVLGGSLVYSDEDADGFYETATITLPSDDMYASELKPYVPGTNGMMEWEIRPVRSKQFVGADIVIVLDSWLLIDPDILEAPVTDEGFMAVDATDPDAYLQTVDVYREYNDDELAAAVYWEPRSCGICSTCLIQLTNGGYILLAAGEEGECPNCGLSMQECCAYIRDYDNGIVVPQANSLRGSRPDQVRFWYRAGLVDENRQRHPDGDPLSEDWARTIAMLATCKLERSLCACGNVSALAEHWREDLSFQGKDGSYFVGFSLLDNPFGTRRGEIAAWKKVSKLTNRIYEGAVL